MNTNIATTKDQSQRLLRCGVSADTADMHFDMDEERYKGWRFTGTLLKLRKCPAWSLSRRLELLPKGMGIAVGAYPGSNRYTCFTLIDPDVEPVVADTAIEVAVQMIEQLTANGYKLNEI